MRKKLLRSHAIYAAQNGLAACLFLLLFIAEGSAYFLHSFPSSEFAWRLSLTANRLAGPILNVADDLLQIPFLLLMILAAAVIAPFIAYKRRSWLGTASSGHIALGVGVFVSFNSLLQAGRDHELASLSGVFDPSILSPSAWSLCAITVVMAVLCMLNHFMFFARIKNRDNVSG